MRKEALFADSQAGGPVDPPDHRRYVPARPSDREFIADAGQELNIAQHARRQAAPKAASAPRFFC